ncbi:adenosylcobinamide-GDP ribazoletransferase [Neobacillus mesonae]|uniref:adenosylcobinamide-GDP ribazoletransferase n=1 Tax=Neobacillus mesonae TaxID=1193713 RepID=UPI0025727E44|nr:adenosylcobinamide-GDP ribazoletransferase [Neobacillus mesonae]MED4205123.1 adenosylcobinamide-GDP ribazoletransferase [Neobacillus mesonae]
MKFLRGFLIGLQFFTAIPITKQFPMDKKHLKRTIQAFPLLGLFQGLIYSVLLFILLEYTPFSHLAAAFLLWIMTILLTGGIHLDGWMDASDAYFSYRDKLKRLEIMKDPRTGAFGVISIIVLLSSRFLFIYEITDNASLNSFILIAAIPFFSKALMGVLLLTVPSAKQEGLGYLFQKAATLKALRIYPVYLLAVVILFPNTWVLLAAAVVCFFFARVKVMKWFGGITGDVLGAAVEGTELILWMTLWLLHYFVMA